MTLVDFHLVVPARMTVEDAHDICDRIERSVRERTGTASITVHVERDGKAEHGGVLFL